MPGSVADRRLFTPATIREALRMLDSEGPLTPLAGCTDLYVALNFGTLKESSFLNLWSLDELRRIEVRGTVLSIGALCTYTQIIESRPVRARLPMLVAASKEIGGPQIQNRGTIGGNVANASPAGDTLPILAATDAMLLLKSASGERRVPFNEFYTGYRRSVLRTNELIAAVEIPAVKGRQWFRKVGTRAAQAISKVVMAGVDPGRDIAPRIAIGSVAPTVVRLPSTEAALAAGAPIMDAQRILLDEIAPIDDVRSTAEYRRRVAANLLVDFWRKRARG
ncbi:MAG TPA: FAD binding domain-containing protein [Casimicrobiaceae bacterium]|nr:FAD binding domain-containing protein [Casimicrobiaceae bacterium]